MTDDRTATELYKALKGKLRRRNGHSTDTYVARDEIAIERYPELLKALEAAAESLNNVGAHVPAEAAWEVLARQRERLLEALR